MTIRPGTAFLLLSALTALAASPRAQGALADSAAWEPLGDEPFQTSALGFTGPPEDLTVWTLESGIYRLDGPPDGPLVRIDIGPSSGQIHFFGPGPLRPDTVFAGDGLYRSVDGGETFERVYDPAGDSGSGNETIGDDGSLARFPPDSPYPYRLVVGDWPSFVYSDDGGDSWTRAASAPKHGVFHVVAFRSGRAVSAGFYGAARSEDGGVTWQPIPALYDTTRIRYDLHQMLLLPGFVTGQAEESEEGRLLVAGSEADVGGTQVWASDDEGATWRRTASFDVVCASGQLLTTVGAEVGGDPGWAVFLACDGVVHATTDGGETWAVLGRVPGTGWAGREGEGPYTFGKAVAVGPDGRLYAGTSRQGPTDSWSYRTRGSVAEAIRLAVAEEPGAPESPAGGLGLSVYPNPTGGTATLALALSAPERVRVVVYDVQGREVARVHDGPATDGGRFTIETGGLPAGSYLVRATTASGASATTGLTVAR